MTLLPSLSTDAPPGRVLTYLTNPEKGTLPASCTLKIVNPTNLHEDLRFFSRILRDGAGGKAILNNWYDHTPIKVNWRFYLSPLHLDYYRMSSEQKKHFSVVSLYDWDEIITVDDSMEESSVTGFSIEESWRKFIDLAIQGKRILVNLSNLRPVGTLNDRGLRATGPLGLEGLENEGSFLAIYEAIANHLEDGTITSFIDLLGQLNQTIRRGGQFKDGIITSSIPWNHPSCLQYLKHPLHLIPGSHKKGVQFEGSEELPSQELLELIAHKHNTESLFLEKTDPNDLDYHWNVCVGIKVPNLGTCLLYRTNLAQCEEPDDISMAMVSAMRHLLELHVGWRASVGNERSGHYAPLREDRQVALDIMGLASALAHWGVSYQELADAMEEFMFMDHHPDNSMAWRIVYALAKGYRETTILADDYMDDLGLPRLKYLHSIEPQQKSAEGYKDLSGYSCTRNIDPPFHHRQWRVSEARGRKLIRYNPKCELAKDVGADLHLRFCELWQQFMELCGRPHGISYDNWKQATADDVKDFLTRSPLKTWYYNYSHQIDQSYLDKGQVVDACNLEQGCVVCAE